MAKNEKLSEDEIDVIGGPDQEIIIGPEPLKKEGELVKTYAEMLGVSEEDVFSLMSAMGPYIEAMREGTQKAEKMKEIRAAMDSARRVLRQRIRKELVAMEKNSQTCAIDVPFKGSKFHKDALEEGVFPQEESMWENTMYKAIESLGKIGVAFDIKLLVKAAHKLGTPAGEICCIDSMAEIIKREKLRLVGLEHRLDVPDQAKLSVAITNLAEAIDKLSGMYDKTLGVYTEGLAAYGDIDKAVKSVLTSMGDIDKDIEKKIPTFDEFRERGKKQRQWEKADAGGFHVLIAEEEEPKKKTTILNEGAVLEDR